MGRRFTAATPDRIHCASAGLGGFSYRWGTIAAVVNTAATSGQHSVVGTNDNSGATVLFGLVTSRPGLIWNGSTQQYASGFFITTGRTTFIAMTKGSGTVGARFHMYEWATNTWWHEASGGTIGDAAVTTSVTFGAEASSGGSDWDGDIFQVGMWPSVNMTDSEVERLVTVPSMDWGRTGAGLFVRFSDHAEVGDLKSSQGRYNVRQTARTGTTRGTYSPPPGFGTSAPRRRR